MIGRDDVHKAHLIKKEQALCGALINRRAMDAYDYINVPLGDIHDLCLVCLSKTRFNWTDTYGVGWEG